MWRGGKLHNNTPDYKLLLEPNMMMDRIFFFCMYFLYDIFAFMTISPFVSCISCMEALNDFVFFVLEVYDGNYMHVCTTTMYSSIVVIEVKVKVEVVKHSD